MTFNKDFEEANGKIIQVKIKNQELPTHGRLLDESIKFIEIQLKRGDIQYIRKSNILSVLVQDTETPIVEF